MNRKNTIRWVAGLVLSLGMAAEAVAQGNTSREAGRATEFILYTQWMDAFRTCGREQPKLLPERFLERTSTAALTWESVFGANFLPATQADFFRGAIPLAGPYSGRKMVMGLYNPHWDAILLVLVSGNLPKNEDDLEEMRLPKGTGLLFMSGEAFRGEATGEPDFSTVLPGGGGRGPHPDEPLSPGIWRAQVRTMRRFNELYPAAAEEDPRLKASALGEIDTDADMERLIARVGVRLRCLVGLHQTPEWRAVAERMEQVLQLGLGSQMKRYFQNPIHEEFIDTYAKLPKTLKTGFRAYGCVANREGTLYLLVNQDYPRLYATVSVPVGRIRNPDAGTVDFEWYDLDQAEALLAAWESRPGAR